MFFSSVSTYLDISSSGSRLLGVGRDESLLIASAITLSISSSFFFFEGPPELQEGEGEGVGEGATEHREVRLGVGEGERMPGDSSTVSSVPDSVATSSFCG